MSDKNRRALLIGIDHYPDNQRLLGCVKDAQTLTDALEHDENGDRNFECRLLTSLNPQSVTEKTILSSMDQLFASDSECVLFYFAGHSTYNPAQGTGYFIPLGNNAGAKGIDFRLLIEHANRAYPKIKSTIILIDSCNSGAIGEQVSNSSRNDVMATTIGTGVTLMTSSGRSESATENSLDGGFFTSVIVDGLKGSAADLRGHVTPASLYSLADQLLGVWDDQRPLYKANVKSFVSLRRCKPKLDRDTLCALPLLFPDGKDDKELDVTYEPKRDGVEEQYKNIPVNKENVAAFKKLQACNRYGLVAPVGEEHMYYAAKHEKSCKLTELGKHYRYLAKRGRL